MPQLQSINPRFPWTRYWRVLEDTRGHVEGDSDESSFLRLPWSPILDGLPEIPQTTLPYQKLSDLLQKPAVILLGRPGSGKTTELMALRELQTHEGSSILYFDAKETSSEPTAIFSDPRWQKVEGRSALLVLDGVDELLMECPRYAHIFSQCLRQKRESMAAGSLRVVISCRHAEWPEGLDIWPREELVTARLCHLTQDAAEAFVRAHLPERAEVFWQQLHNQNLEFMAVWPHSLGELVIEFDRQGRLPTSLFELLKNATLRRCDPNDSDSARAERHPDNQVDVPWYHRIAGRLAALSCFSGRHRLTAKMADPDCIGRSDIFTEPEPWLDHTAKLISETDLRELFKTALFIPLAGDRFSFSHQMFREFMAAWWLAERGVTLPQLESLFGTRELDGKWRHYPQLAAIAAWLASNPTQTTWQDFLIENDPGVLLRADAVALPDSQKKRIVKALLDQAVADRAVDAGWRHGQLRSFACPGLAEVLRPYLVKYTSNHEAARRLAIDIVKEAHVEDAAPFLWEAVRKPQTRLRSQIAYALQQVASEGHDCEWQAVIDGEISLDENGSLLGAALLALVPRKLKVRNVLEHLIPQRDFGIYGTFTGACDAMVARLEKDDAKAVVRRSARCNTWGITPRGDKDKPTLVSKALCWLAEDLDDPESLQLFAEWWLASVRDYREVNWDSKPLSLRDLKFDQAAIRYRVLDACIQHSSAAFIRSEDLFWNLFQKFILLPDDLDWLITGVLTSNTRAQHIYATWLREAFRATDLTENQKVALLNAWNQSEVLRSKLTRVQDGENIFEAIERERKKFQQDHLTEAERLRAAMEAKEAERRTRLERIVPLTLEDHRRFLLKASPPFPLSDMQERLRTEFAAVDALQAVWSILDNDPELQAAITEDWLAHILNQMLRGYGVEDDFTLPAVLTRFAPQILSAMLRVVVHNYLHHGGLHELKLLDPFTSEVTAKIKQMLVDNPVQVEGFMNAHAWLARVDPTAAEEVILCWIALIPLKSTEPAHLMVLASAMANLGGKLWPQIRPHVCADRQITCQVLTLAFGRSHEPFTASNPATEWDAYYLADVTELFFTSFSQEKDWRSGERQAQSKLVSILEERGMTSTVQRLIHLGLKDSQTWLWAAHQRAMASRIAREWPVVSPGDLLQLAKDHDFSLVRDDSSLQTAVLLALDLYQLDLKTSDHGRKLFNDDQTPRIEDALSDHLAQWLKDKLKIVGHREVKTSHGKYEDLHISLPSLGKEGPHLVFEVKKHDSDQLMAKMETQLKKLYLEGQNRTHGIYLVYWFEDKATATFEQVSEQLAAQARQLSQPPYQIRAKVLDCRLETLIPPDPHKKPKAKGTKGKTKKKTAKP